MSLTPELLVRVVGCTPDLAALYAPHLTAACAAYSINTPARLAAFLAQLGHESGSFRYVRELASGEAYEGRRDLGNTEPGDGVRYKGRGLIQTTGRHNYRATFSRMRAKLGEDVPNFEAEPAALEQPRWAVWSAADYWDSRGLNDFADDGDFDRITRRINGGLNGKSDRDRRHAVALSVFAESIPAPSVAPPPTRTPAVAPKPENPLMIPVLLQGLAGALIDVFTPLAREKLEKEMSRHTADSQVAEQVTTGLIEAAKTATGLSDPIAAVAAVQADPVATAQVEQSAMALLSQLGPVLAQIEAMEAAAVARTEQSRDAAELRARGGQQDQDEYLTKAIVRMLVGVLVGGAITTAVLAYLKVDVQVILGALLALVGTIGGKFNTRYDYRYGSSAGSAAKDISQAAVMDQLSKKR